MVKNSPDNAGDIRDSGSIPGSIPGRRKWLLTPVFLPGESHGQEPRRLPPWGCKESDTTDRLSTHKEKNDHSFIKAMKVMQVETSPMPYHN